MKKVIIINGTARSGKDTVVEIFTKLQNKIVFNKSTVEIPKEIATSIGWDGTKDDKSRKFLSDLKDLITEYNDGIFKSLINFVNLQNQYSVIFIHCREPKEIAKFKEYFGDQCVTLLVDAQKRLKHIPDNHADKNVYNYKYDLVIDNNSTIENLHEEVKKLIEF